MTPRRLLGTLLIVAGFALVIAYSLGWVELFGYTGPSRDIGAALAGAAPNLLLPLALFLLGLWLAKGGRRR
ncbi:hypothetical protein [Lysobacter humi (ex Lee et al. 2017)]